MALVTPNQPIHPSFDERISVKVEGQLPQFVKEDHATFVAFLEAYYEYMEQQGKPYEIIGNLDNYVNLDKTTDDFLNYFKKQFGKDIPETVFANANKPFVLKHLRDFYRSKGSEKAFQFLFRLLFKEEISFYYPSTDLLRTSDGKYNNSKVIRTVDTSGTDMIFSITGKKIIGKTSKASAIVEIVLNENIGSFVVSTIFLSGVVGEFQNGEKVYEEGKTWTFTLGGMVTGYNITNPGNGYSVGDVIPIVGGGGSAAGALLRVSELTSGSISSTTIVSGGTGYTIGDKLTFDNMGTLNIDGRTASILVRTVDNAGTITSLEIENPGRGYYSFPTISGGGTGTGANVSLSGVGIGGIKTLKIAEQGYGFTTTPTFNFTTKGDGTATGTVTISGYEPFYQAGFFNNDGFLSSTKYIQDSNYYQLFSYVISSGQNIAKWRDTVKRLAHPAGLALFGNIQLISMLDLTMKITGIPQRKFYTIIFHDGDIAPPVILDLKVDTCEGLTAPTVCQTYEQDLGIQKLINIGGLTGNDQSGCEDYNYITVAADASRSDDYGLITDGSISHYIDYERKQNSVRSRLPEPNENRPANENFTHPFNDGHHVTQLRLGPIRRNVDRNKWRKYDSNTTPIAPYRPPTGLGGMTQTIGNIAGTFGKPGMQIGDLKDEKIIDYALFGGLKTRKVTGTTTTRFQSPAGSSFNLVQQISPMQDQFMRFFADRTINNV